LDSQIQLVACRLCVYSYYGVVVELVDVLVLVELDVLVDVLVDELVDEVVELDDDEVEVLVDVLVAKAVLIFFQVAV
jgi:hypothetical protein